MQSFREMGTAGRPLAHESLGPWGPEAVGLFRSGGVSPEVLF